MTPRLLRRGRGIVSAAGTPPHYNFTLIEFLAIIAIVAILAGDFQFRPLFFVSCR